MQEALARIASASTRRLTRALTLVPAALLGEARRYDPHVDLDELAGARLCASEFGDGSPAELACIVDAAAEMAARKQVSLVAHLTGGLSAFGPEGGKRPASTRQHPTMRHLAAARAVLSGNLRGIARGARRFFSPKQQDRSHRAFKAGRTLHKHTCSALGLLRAWSFDLPRCPGVGRCCGDGNPVASNPGPNLEMWVGPIPGVDALRLMLMRPATAGEEHAAAYAAARAVIQGVG